MIDTFVLLDCHHVLSIKDRVPKVGTPEYCKRCGKNVLVTRRMHAWTIRCVHIEHSMTRTYNVDKDYARDRALAHTRKYGPKHLCMLYQKADFDGTMEIIYPDVLKNQTVLDLSESELFGDVSSSSPYPF